MKTNNTLSIIIMISLFTLFLSSCTTPTPEEGQFLYEMGQNLIEKFQEMPGISQRIDIANYFNNYIINLGLISFAFGGEPQLQVYVFPYNSDHMATASFSQFEAPPSSSTFWDCAFVVRPNANLRAPYFSGDAANPIGGMNASFEMDFYNVNNGSIDIDTFFGDQITKINQALELVKDFQRTGKDRGKYTRHLDPYKSNYRIEIELPYSAVEAERKTYLNAAHGAFTLFLDAYLISLARLEPENDDSLIQGTKDGTDEFIQILLDYDYAVLLGRMMFGNDFEKYFTDAMWRDGYYGEG